ncbi:MAG: diacylglycerol kinase family lipid kinase [Clostridia bacterium]|nr:diacylglycerol kinase family lipid kinase [Clostridia bacterium]MBQ7289196.1 diacylglycerol kinase family lipid kinase [Clostridia bacterium]
MLHAFIVNPAAGKGKESKILIEKIAAFFKEHSGNYKILTTDKEGDATVLTRQVCQENKEVTVFACGGDGTTFEVLNGVVGCKNARLGIIPCGSGNDFIKYFGDRAAFLDLDNQLRGDTVALDAIKIGERFAINSCSVGMDAMVADNVRFFKKLPISAGLAYILSSVYTVFKKFNSELEITIDGQYLGKTPCFFAVCANAPFYGGGFKCAPTACPGDGKLEFSILQSHSKFQIVKILGHYRKGTHITLNNCRYGNCHTMEISANQPFAINLDGEVFHGDHVKFELLERAVNFVLPKSLVPTFGSKLGRTAEFAY